MKLASCIPKDQRGSHDSLLLALDDLLKNGERDPSFALQSASFALEKTTQLSNNEREELLNQIDFSRVTEETIAACKNNQLIPQQVITEAALSLCAKLRQQLEETQARLRSVEGELARSRPSYTSSGTSRRRFAHACSHLL